MKNLKDYWYKNSVFNLLEFKFQQLKSITKNEFWTWVWATFWTIQKNKNYTNKANKCKIK